MNCPKKEQINISASQTVSQPAFNNCHEIESKDQWFGKKLKKKNHVPNTGLSNYACPEQVQVCLFLIWVADNLSRP